MKIPKVRAKTGEAVTFRSALGCCLSPARSDEDLGYRIDWAFTRPIGFSAPFGHRFVLRNLGPVHRRSRIDERYHHRSIAPYRVSQHQTYRANPGAHRTEP